METKKEILEELESRFEEFKKKSKLSISLKDLDEVFRIKDYILRERFVSEKISRQISTAISDIFLGNLSYLHGLIMPNPQNMLGLAESKIFEKDEKQGIYDIMAEIVELLSKNHLNSFDYSESEEGRFISSSFEFWEKKLKIKMKHVLKKVNEYWRQKKE